MATYYRFQNDQPYNGETVHWFLSPDALKKFSSMMRIQEPDFYRMKFWGIEGIFIRTKDKDVVVRVNSFNQIYLTF